MFKSKDGRLGDIRTRKNQRYGQINEQNSLICYSQLNPLKLFYEQRKVTTSQLFTTVANLPISQVFQKV